MSASLFSKLAKLADLKAALEVNATGIDDELNRLLAQASAMAEQVAGVPSGGLRRATAIVEYPAPRVEGEACVCLLQRPIESIDSIKLAETSSTPTQFSSLASLVEHQDWFVTSSELAGLCLISETWSTQPRANQVIYTAGFADPDAAFVDGSLLPPPDLQGAIVIQATQLYNLRRAHGLKGVTAGEASRQLSQADVHPALYQAAMRYRRASL